jgi:O-antigen/teichoic acid export membrane protein
MTVEALSKQFWRIGGLFIAGDQSTAEGRAHERHRRLALGALTAALAKLISITATLISVPLTLHYLGPERYGIWLTISSFIAIMSFADLGLGNGLLSSVASAHGQDDTEAIRNYVSSGIATLTIVALVLAGLFAALSPLISWPAIFNVQSPQAMAEVGPAVSVFGLCFALTIPASIVQKVQIGLQQSFVASLWQCLASVLTLAAIIAATHFRLGLPWLVLAFMGAPLAVALINNIVFFSIMRRDIAPTRSRISPALALHTMRIGLMFLVLQLVGAVAFSSDALVITQVLGPASVPQYAVPAQMFNVVSQLIVMSLAPLWPAYGEASSRADHDWVKTTFLRSLTISVAFAAIGAACITIAGPLLLHFWVGTAIQAPLALLLGLAIWKIIEAAGNAAAMLLNGLRLVRFQIVVAIVTGAVILALKFFLIKEHGIIGVIYATILGFVIFTGIPVTLRLRPLWRHNLERST